MLLCEIRRIKVFLGAFESTLWIGFEPSLPRPPRARRMKFFDLETRRSGILGALSLGRRAGEGMGICEL